MPTPNTINLTAIGNQTVGQSLTLECRVATVRGITSRVDIAWSSNGSELQRTEGVNVHFLFNSLVIYADSYNILQLNTSDDGRVYQCEVFVNTSPSVAANDNITLDLNG